MTIHFPDLSHYVTPPLDGAVALITKATQSTAYVDPTYAAYKADAERRGIPFCGYHWVDTTDLGLQAAHAVKVMGATPCMWDAEAAGATVPRLAELTRRYRSMGGNPRLVYLPRWFWRDHLGSPSLKPLLDEGLALVSSAYPSTGYTENGIGWQPYGGMVPTIWQWSDNAPFNGAHVDMNAYKGTVDELRVVFGLAPPLAPPTKEDDVKQILVRFVDAADPAQIWKCDGQFRRMVLAEWWGGGSGPVTNVQAHQEVLLGNLATGPAGDGTAGHWDKTGTVFSSHGNPDVWGIDVATLQGGDGIGPHTHPIPAADTGPASTG